MRKILVLGSLLLVATMLVAACGGDDDDDDDDAGSDSTPTATATMDDSDDGNGGDDDSSNGDDDSDAGDDDVEVSGGGSFRGYANDICTALADFTQQLPTLMNPQQFAAGNFQSIAEPYADLADSLEGAQPPDELAEYHAALVQAIRTTADALEDGGPEAFAKIEDLSDFPTPPNDVLERWGREAGDLAACRSVGFVDGS